MTVSQRCPPQSIDLCTSRGNAIVTDCGPKSPALSVISPRSNFRKSTLYGTIYMLLNSQREGRNMTHSHHQEMVGWNSNINTINDSKKEGSAPPPTTATATGKTAKNVLHVGSQSYPPTKNCHQRQHLDHRQQPLTSSNISPSHISSQHKFLGCQNS